MSQKIYITVGLPGCGKSTWAEYMASSSSDNKIVSRDVLRKMVVGHYRYDETHEDLIEDLARACITRLLHSDYDVIIDDCHPTRESRLSLCNYIRRDVHVEIIYVYFPIGVMSAIRRKYKVNPHLWDHVIRRMNEIFEVPTIDENPMVDKIIEIPFVEI